MGWTADTFDRSTPPTSSTHYPNGSIEKEEWLVDGKSSRVGEPATIYYAEDGSVSFCAWNIDGVERADGPAWVEIGGPLGWTANYAQNDFFHRIDGPATVGIYPDGKPRWIVYSVEDLRHRTDGPAELFYDWAGNVDEKFFLLDTEVTAESLEPYRLALEAGAPPEWALAFALGTGTEGWLTLTPS